VVVGGGGVLIIYRDEMVFKVIQFLASLTQPPLPVQIFECLHIETIMFRMINDPHTHGCIENRRKEKRILLFKNLSSLQFEMVLVGGGD
jgi:hypothetical protein